MNWILSKIAGPYLVYAILGLAVLLGVQHIALRITKSQLEAKTEAFKARGVSIDNLSNANLSWFNKYEALQKTHANLLKENLRIDREAQDALAAQKREYASLDRAFSKYKAQFDKRSPDCENALRNLNKMCPNLRGY